MDNVSKVNSQTKISDIKRYRFHYLNEDSNFPSNETFLIELAHYMNYLNFIAVTWTYLSWKIHNNTEYWMIVEWFVYWMVWYYFEWDVSIFKT